VPFAVSANAAIRSDRVKLQRLRLPSDSFNMIISQHEAQDLEV
jgi:hypothetical protein